MIKNKMAVLSVLILIASPAYSVFNNIQDGDDVLASPVMQNFRHVNYGNVLKPVDSSGNNNDDALDLGTNTVRWKDIYFSSQLLSDDGSVSAPSISNSGDGDTGIYFPSDNTLAIGTSGVEAFRIGSNGGTLIPTLDITSSFNVGSSLLHVEPANSLIGINNASPQNTLDILPKAGTNAIKAKGASGEYILQLINDSPAGSSRGVYIQAGGNSSDYIMSVRDRDASSEIFYIKGDGFIGVGTTSPDTYLHLSNDVSGISDAQLRITDGTDSRESSIYNNSGDLIISTHGTDNVSDSNITIETSQIVMNTSGGQAFKLDSSQRAVFYEGIDSGNNGAFLKSKVIEIGDWNMDSSDIIDVAHGVSDHETIRICSVMIRDDGGSYMYELDDGGSFMYDTGVQGGIGRIGDTNIRLVRISSGFFDDTNFSSTSYNRGWVTIWYE